MHQIELEMQNDELKRAHLALEESRDRYLDLYDSAPVGYFSFTRGGQIIEVNLTGAALLGLPRSRLIRRGLGSFVVPEDRDRWERHLASVLGLEASAQGPNKKQSCELKLLRADGSTFHARLESARFDRPEAQEKPRVGGEHPVIRAALSDITERDQANDALKRASEQQHLALDAAGMGTWDYHFDTGEVFWDEICRNQWGFSEGEKTDKPTAIAAIHPEDRAAAEEALQRALAGTEGGAYHQEFRVMWRDGSVHWIDSHGQVYFQGEGAGRSAVRFIGANRDITESKAVEAARAFLSIYGYEAVGQDFFQALARHLAQSLGMDYVCIDRLQGDGLVAQTVAVYFDGKFEENVTYALKDTPCGEVVDKTLCCFAEGIRRLFPRDVVLQEMMAESYVGTILQGYDGKPIGLIAVIGRKPLPNPRLAESVLKTVAVRAAGELERQRAEGALRQAHRELELRVQQRTAELRQANESLCREVKIRRQTEQQLREAELRYRTVAEFAFDWTYWETPDHALRYCSPSCEQITGYSALEFMADPTLLEAIIHPEDAGIWRNRRYEKPMVRQFSSIQFRIRRKDGSIRWLEHVGRPVIGSDGQFQGIRANDRDVTERRRLEREVLDIGERERQRIGRDLHDSLGGGLSGLAMLSKALVHILAGRPSGGDCRGNRSGHQRGGPEDSRDRPWPLSGGLSAFGFINALEELARTVEKRYGLRCRVRAPRDIVIGDDRVASHLFHIAEEAVNNAVRHSQARHIEIAVRRPESAVVAERPRRWRGTSERGRHLPRHGLAHDAVSGGSPGRPPSRSNRPEPGHRHLVCPAVRRSAPRDGRAGLVSNMKKTQCLAESAGVSGG